MFNQVVILLFYQKITISNHNQVVFLPELTLKASESLKLLGPSTKKVASQVNDERDTLLQSLPILCCYRKLEVL